ncbi:magnesium transporter [Bacillus mesophilus]|uniref:Magnesium transporter CorA family protein n=1 Tax=Bacillus mesophilus TaxID=1808955 RepID=A0A6M0Q767_9BACI|nr:magnesium transporter CorA family protein [Bacillus mesophilus]MBM7660230.1 magnesium transporter [Bacillus mesophilus]NEY70948.1 magnesium transporter CorA family protein [Bacillus mesophilus]
MLIYSTRNNTVTKKDEFSLPTSNEEIAWIHFHPTNSDQFDHFISSLDIHPLALKGLKEYSDIPKIDVFKNEAIISLIAIQQDYTEAKITILVGHNYVVSKVENDLHLAKNLEQPFMDHPESMSHVGMILFHIFDQTISQDLEIIDQIADEIQSLEKKVFKDPFENKIARSVYRWKATLHQLRQTIEAQEDVMETMSSEKFPYNNEESRYFIESLSNNYARVINGLDTFKESLNSIFNLQMTLKADHSNAIMKTLTLVSVIFLPMTFLAGLYGMNFEKMPELKWNYGYLYALILMLLTGLSIALFFRRKGWWGKGNDY